jgi:hypothetical protein
MTDQPKTAGTFLLDQRLDHLGGIVHVQGVVVSIMRGTPIDQGLTAFIPITTSSTLWAEIRTQMQQYRDNLAQRSDIAATA